MKRERHTRRPEKVWFSTPVKLFSPKVLCICRLPWTNCYVQQSPICLLAIFNEVNISIVCVLLHQRRTERGLTEAQPRPVTYQNPDNHVSLHTHLPHTIPSLIKTPLFCESAASRRAKVVRARSHSQFLNWCTLLVFTASTSVLKFSSFLFFSSAFFRLTCQAFHLVSSAFSRIPSCCWSNNVQPALSSSPQDQVLQSSRILCNRSRHTLSLSDTASFATC